VSAPPPPPPPHRGGGGSAPETLVCEADGYTRDGKYTRECFGADAELATKRPEKPGSGYGRAAYMRFALPPLRAPPSRALLRVFALGGDGGGRTVVHAHAVSDVAWQEGALTDAAAPAFAPAPAASVRVGGMGCFVAWDVTAAVAAAAASGAPGVAFALLNAEPSEKTNTWASRRAGPDTAPHISLTY
jgi:hypothetical protein